MKKIAISAIALVAALIMVESAIGDDKARDLVTGMDYLLRGVDSSYSRYTMIIEKKRWKKPRTIKMKSWDQRSKEGEAAKAFILITAPVSESGKAFLKIGNDMWSYFPNVNTTTKIPPSMMLQDWMGSDFSNDDLVRESSIINDYTHKILDTRNEGGLTIHTVELIPKPAAPVTWGKIVVEIRESDKIPISQKFYNDKGALVRTMLFQDIKDMGGRIMPTRWIMKPADKPEDSTVLIVDEMTSNQKIDSRIFTLANLRKGGK